MTISSLDAQYHTFGSSYVTHYPTLDPTTNLLGVLDIAILPQSLITVAGRIGSIQFYSSGSGTVTIYVIHLKTLFHKKRKPSLYFLVASSHLYSNNDLLLWFEYLWQLH